MLHLGSLTDAMAEALGSIPALTGQLAAVNPVAAYIDENPARNSLEKAIYQMQPGQVLVAAIRTERVSETMSKWSHLVEIYMRALRGYSDLDLVDAIVNGVPQGASQVWWLCPLIAGALTTELGPHERRTDSEGVDYWVIVTETAETGDWPRP
jgi:hypothetical protein